MEIPFSTPSKESIWHVLLLFLNRTLDAFRKSCSDPSSCGFCSPLSKRDICRGVDGAVVCARMQVRHSFIIVSVILIGQVFYFIPSMCYLSHVREEYLLAQDLEQKRLERGNVWAVPFLLQNWHCRTSLWDRPTPSTVKNIIKRR